MLTSRNEDHLPNQSQHFDPFRTINSSNYGTWVPPNFASKPRKTEGKRDSSEAIRNDDEEVQLRLLDSGGGDSGIQSPPFWMNSRPMAPASPHSPVSRKQAIARGQRELMEMVKNMPESCYELSLKDLVELPKEEKISQEECLIQERNHDDHDHDHDQEMEAALKKMNSNKKTTKKRGGRIRSGDHKQMEDKGLFLKMGFPFGLKLRSSKKRVLNPSSAKVSPKPEGSEKEWWKKRFSFSSESDGSRSSSHSRRSRSSGSTTTTRRNRGFLTSCFHFFPTKNTSAE